MKQIIIVGGGDLGSYVASILSKSKYNVLLIDKDPKVLQEISSSNPEITTRVGSGTDWQLLDDLLEFTPDVFLALTGDDETNLVACSIAKQLQYPRTIARLKDASYLNRTRLDFGRIFNVDYFIAPQFLVAQEMVKHILSPGSIFIENFANGELQLRTITIPIDWLESSGPLRSFYLPPNIIVGLIRRKKPLIDRKEGDEYEVIFPHGDDVIMAGDEVTFIGETQAIADIPELFGVRSKLMDSIVIAGGSLIGFYLAELLAHRNIEIRIIDKSYEKCTWLAEKLRHCTVIQHDATDLNFLRAEEVGKADLLLSCTTNDAINLLIGLLGKQLGSQEAHVVLQNASYTSLVSKFGLKHTVSPRVIATNHILSQFVAGKVTSLVSLYENQAEIIEITVSMNSKVVGIRLAELGPFLPKDLLILMIQNRGRNMIAHGNRVISPGDTVVLVTNPDHVSSLEKIF